MNNLTQFYSNNLIEDKENLYLYFSLGQSKYALSVQQVMEIMKLPLLDYPQKLANNVVGLLNYNNFTINVLDLRFYLDIKVTPYSVSNQILVVKTDETIFGLMIDKVEDIIPIDSSKIEYFSFSEEKKIIEYFYKKDEETISVINLSAIENILKEGVAPSEIDIPSLFPTDDTSRYKLIQRHQALIQKFESNLVTNIFSQDKFISFSLDDIIYCINLEYVCEFLKNSSITKIPCELDYIAGITTLRGDFVTIIALNKFLFEDESPSKPVNLDGKNSLIILETPDFKIGFLVDEIFDIMEIPEDLINQNTYKHFPKYILSEVIIEETPHTILNIKNILSDERFYIKEG